MHRAKTVSQGFQEKEENLVYQAHRGSRAQWDLWDQWALPVSQVQREREDREATQVHPEKEEDRETLAKRDRPAQLGLLVQLDLLDLLEQEDFRARGACQDQPV